MDVESFLSSDALRFPGTRDGKDLRQYLVESFVAYNGLLDGLVSSDSTVRRIIQAKAKIKFLCEKLIESIDSTYIGHPHLAYKAVDEAIQAVRPYFARLANTSRAADWLNPRGLFRARTGSSHRLGRKDLFHVPFDMREKIASQRYSLPGLPCLYLGSSLYVCWEELGRPEVASLQVARFEVVGGKKLTILTMGPSPGFLRVELGKSKGFGSAVERMFANAAVCVAVCWPLIFSCSLRVWKYDHPFVPEYIVPQLVLQWVTATKGVDGVQYPSMAVDYQRVSSPLGMNYVFPVKSKRNSGGFCSFLAKTFYLTEPLSCGVARMYFEHSAIRDATRSSEEDFRLVPELGMNYLWSELGSVELLLKQMRAASVNE